MPGRASALVFLLVGVAACTRDGPDDPAIATPGAGIPAGAVGAVGVGFDPRPPAHTEPSLPPRKKSRGPQPLLEPLPPDPFAEPEGPGTAHPHGPPPATTHQGTTL